VPGGLGGTTSSAQKAELTALAKALDLGAGKKINIYMDSRYAFATAHIHRDIYLERGLLTSRGKEIKTKQEILNLLDAPKKVATVSISHCPGHQNGRDSVAQGNNQADQVAPEVAMQEAYPGYGPARNTGWEMGLG
jgi:ribonuclease HI